MPFTSEAYRPGRPGKTSSTISSPSHWHFHAGGAPKIQERKISPKRKFWGRTSRGHPGVIRADIPAQNFGQGGRNPGKNKHFGADIHDPKARTSTTLSGFQNFGQKKLWVEFSFPKNVQCHSYFVGVMTSRLVSCAHIIRMAHLHFLHWWSSRTTNLTSLPLQQSHHKCL